VKGEMEKWHLLKLFQGIGRKGDKGEWCRDEFN
jgi:hypothetical protein